MPSKQTTARIGVKGAKFMARHPTVRRGTVKVGLKAGKVMAKRQALRYVEEAGALLEGAGGQFERLGEGSRVLGQVLIVYGPIVAEVLGLIEPPKPRRTALKVTVGIVIGAAAMYFLEPERRQRLQQLGGGSR